MVFVEKLHRCDHWSQYPSQNQQSEVKDYVVAVDLNGYPIKTSEESAGNAAECSAIQCNRTHYLRITYQWVTLELHGAES